MIPYPELFTLHLWIFPIQIWGVLVSLGLAIAAAVAYQRARRAELSGAVFLDLVFWIIVAAFIGARLFHVFFYEWTYYAQHLREIARVDQGGLSSFGGFIGAAGAFLIYTRYHKLKMLLHAEVLMFAWPLGHGIGRIGCFLTHMHPGQLSSAPFAVAYPGGARLDMGLMESVVLLSYWVIIWLALRRRRFFVGFYVISGMIFYGSVRFILDFFRASDLPMSDVRYVGLTPAQYGSIILVVIGVYLMYYRRINKLEPKMSY